MPASDFESFTGLSEAVRTLRDGGDGARSIELLEAHVDSFPLHTGLVFLTLAEALADAGRRDDAVDALRRALGAGCRYRREWLVNDPHFSAIVEMPGFAEVAGRAAERYAEAAAAARPHLTARVPDGPPPASGYPLLLALHGNNSNSAETVGYWAAAADQGWVVAVPQSSEVGASPDAFTWNDRERTARELQAHLGKIARAVSVDRARTVIAGFSMGGLQAVAIVVTRRIAARGVMPVAAWLPHIREFTELVEAGTGRASPAYVVVGDRDPSRAGAKELVDLFTRHGARALLDERTGLGHEYPNDMSATLGRALEFLSPMDG